MALLNGLPVYSIKIKEDLSSNTGIDFISLVDYPAIETNWVAMAGNKIPLKFIANADKQLLYGPILIADQPIYRYDKDMGEYYVVFTAEEIQKLVRKFQASQKSINLNYQHKKDSQLNQAVIQEIWLTGVNDKSKDLGFDLPVNSAFVCAHIGDKKFWDDEVKTKNVMGFSIEGFLDMEMKSIKKNINMSNQKFEVHKQADGCGDVYIDGPIAVDNYVFSNYPSITLVDGKKQVTQYPIWQETIVLEDGTILTLKDSKILKIEKKNAMSKDKFITAKTDAGVEIKSDSENFSVGVEVYTEADGAKTPVADGTYAFDNGTMITVAGGKITEMVEEELSTEEVEVIQKAMKKVTDQFTATLADQAELIKELQAKLANTPGAPSKTSNTDTPATPTKLSAKKQLLTKLSILRKKSAEVEGKKVEPTK